MKAFMERTHKAAGYGLRVCAGSGKRDFFNVLFPFEKQGSLQTAALRFSTWWRSHLNNCAAAAVSPQMLFSVPKMLQWIISQWTKSHSGQNQIKPMERENVHPLKSLPRLDIFQSSRTLTLPDGSSSFPKPTHPALNESDCPRIMQRLCSNGDSVWKVFEDAPNSWTNWKIRLFFPEDRK